MVQSKTEIIRSLILKLLKQYTSEERPSLFATEIETFFSAEAPAYGLKTTSSRTFKFHLDKMVREGELVKGSSYVHMKGYPYSLPQLASSIDEGGIVTFMGAVTTPVDLFNRLLPADSSSKFPVATWNKLRAGMMLTLINGSEDIIFDQDDYREFIRETRDIYLEVVQFLSALLNDSIWAKPRQRELKNHFDFLLSPIKTDEINRRLNELYHNEITSLNNDKSNGEAA
jgi:hypothetical protein